MVIKIFPHSREYFPDIDDLSTWLLTSLKARNGEYHLKSSRWVGDLEAGSIVLFRYGLHQIVGEAVVVGTQVHAKAVSNCEASVWFAPSSIRLFVPPFPIEKLQEIVGGVKIKDLTQANGYPKFEDGWAMYPKLLAAHLSSPPAGSGGHFL